MFCLLHRRLTVTTGFSSDNPWPEKNRALSSSGCTVISKKSWSSARLELKEASWCSKAARSPYMRTMHLKWCYNNLNIDWWWRNCTIWDSDQPCSFLRGCPSGPKTGVGDHSCRCLSLKSTWHQPRLTLLSNAVVASLNKNIWFTAAVYCTDILFIFFYMSAAYFKHIRVWHRLCFWFTQRL